MKDNSWNYTKQADSAYLGGTKWFRAKDVRHLNSHVLKSRWLSPVCVYTCKRARLLSCRALLRTTQQGFGLSQPRDVFSPLVIRLPQACLPFVPVAKSRPFLRYRPHEPALINYISLAMLERKYRAVPVSWLLLADCSRKKHIRILCLHIVSHDVSHYLLQTLPHNVSNYYCHRDMWYCGLGTKEFEGLFFECCWVKVYLHLRFVYIAIN